MLWGIVYIPDKYVLLDTKWSHNIKVNRNIILHRVLDSKKLFDLAAKFYGNKVLVDCFGTIFFV